jgi:hypothetical protein
MVFPEGLGVKVVYEGVLTAQVILGMGEKDTNER